MTTQAFLAATELIKRGEMTDDAKAELENWRHCAEQTEFVAGTVNSQGKY